MAVELCFSFALSTQGFHVEDGRRAKVLFLSMELSVRHEKQLIRAKHTQVGWGGWGFQLCCFSASVVDFKCPSWLCFLAKGASHGNAKTKQDKHGELHEYMNTDDCKYE